MASMITWAGATAPITPDSVDGYQSGRPSGNVVHPIAGRAEPDVSLSPAGLRRGTLKLIFSDEDASKAAEDEHAQPHAFTLSSDDRTSIEMYYVVSEGDITRALDAETRAGWIVEVPFQEIAL